ncbi:MAG: hypothetical protein K8R60_24630 [Burkholderiales bacterium]|nr:hypothetical protein [Burkholderiales bacterium]
MGLLAVLNLKQIDLPERMVETEKAGGGKGDKGGTNAPKVAQVAVEPELEKSGVRDGDESPTTVAPEVSKTGVEDSGPGVEKAAETPAEKKAKSDYKKARDAIQKLIDDLNANAQRGTIMAQINQATAKLAEADAHAGKLEFPQANAALTATGVICAAARKLADDWAAYAKLRASCAAMVWAFTGFDDATVTASLKTTIDQADKLVALTPPNFVAATALLQTIDTTIRPNLKGKVDGNKTKLVALEALDPKVKAFLAPELTKARSLVATLESSFASGEWSVLLSAWSAISDVMGPAARMASRRQAYETQRTATVAACAAVKADATVKGQAPALDALVVQADALANHDTMNFTGGNRMLLDAETRAKAIVAAAPTVAAYNTERVEADKELAALATHAAAGSVAPQLAAVRKLLQDATAAVGLATGNAQAWTTALTAVQRARADLGEAKKVADNLGPTVAAQAAAAKPGDVVGMKAALATLRSDAAAAGKLPFAAEAAAEFKSFTAAADKADKALAKNDGKAGGKALADAAAALAAARSVQSGHGQYATMLATVEGRLKTLQALPTAAGIKSTFEPITKALAEARAADKKKAEVEALAALRRGNDAVAAAEKADRDRTEFNGLATTSLATINALADAKAKKEHGKALDEAKKLADKLRFGDAKSALQAIEVKIDEAKLMSAAAANPGDPQVLAIAKKMAANGGAKTLDALIKGQAEGADPRILTALAEGRYGMAFAVDPTADPKQEVKSMKVVCEMFSKIPQDIVGNTSITKVSHKDSTQRRVGGGFTPATGAIGMTGRPEISAQKFGSALSQTKDGKPVGQLPAKIDPECQPANEKEVDFLAFAAAHEVGHGVDDSKSFMVTNCSKAAFGNWIEHGADMKPVADIVGPHFNFYTTPEQKEYVLSTLLSKPTTTPPVPAAPGDWAKAKQDFDDWYEIAAKGNPWWSQSKCEAITIGGRIYQQAYTRNWVSYAASARNKALTGYQFRAPGEWFAELYAGYRSGKLGKKHPALEWLTKL